MNINFAKMDDLFIKKAIEDGYYNNANEVVRDAVRQLREEHFRLYPETRKSSPDL